MTASVPNSISFDDLQNFADEAAARAIAEAEQKVEKLEPTKENILKVATDCLEQATDIIDDPMVHKIMILEALANLMDWHTEVGKKMFAEGQTDSAVAWLRDAGKLQSCMGILCNIQLGDNDYVTA